MTTDAPEHSAYVKRLITGDPPVPDWVAGFLNRRTDVEVALRAPLLAIKKGQPAPPPLTPEELWALADRLSIPEEFKQ